MNEIVTRSSQSQSHFRRDQYARYHRDVWLPRNLIECVRTALPDPGTVLRLGLHYFENAAGRTTPEVIVMPGTYNVIDVTTRRDDDSLWRCCIRYEWDQDRDLCVVLEFPHLRAPHIPRVTVVTAYWNSRNDRHTTLHVDNYERDPVMTAV